MKNKRVNNLVKKYGGFLIITCKTRFCIELRSKLNKK